MFDAARLARMKPTAYLVNTARGGIIDETALHEALTAGSIAGAGARRLRPRADPDRQPAAEARQFHLRAAHGRRDAGGRRADGDRHRAEHASVLDGKPNRENVVNKEVLG